MLFNSIEFIVFFLPLTLIVFFQIGGRGQHRLAVAWLVFASLFFYGWWNYSYLILLVSSILVNYFIGNLLQRKNTKNKQEKPHLKKNKQSINQRLSRKALLVFGIVLNLSLIGYFKYANFFVNTINEIVKTDIVLQRIILPLAISFFTFQQIAYLIDAYQQKTEEYNFLDYCLFVSFFPQLIAGPIVHHKDIIPQFYKKNIYKFRLENLSIGSTIFILGLFKKIVFADSIAIYATPVFNSAAQGNPPTFFYAWGAALAYTMQLYFDFSGYSDMAIGVARMFGIKLPLNFNSPYKSINISDFWRRWHITLSNFLRDYIYIPLGGNRRGKLRRNLNLMITMLLGGLWHGAGWNFILWGGLHGTFLICNHQWHSFRKMLGHDLKKHHWFSKIFGCLFTYLAIVIGWVFFRAENLNTAWLILEGMVGKHGIALPSLIANKLVPLKLLLESLGARFPEYGAQDFVLTYISLFILHLIVWFTPNTTQWLENYQPVIESKINHKLVKNNLINLWSQLRWQPSVLSGLIVGLLVFIITKTIVIAPASEFLYFNF